MSRRSKLIRASTFDIVNTLLMLVLTVILAYPMLYVALASFSDPAKFASFRGLMFIPQGFTLEAYRLVLRNPNILNGYMNTIIVVVVGTSLNMVLTSMLAYTLSRSNLMLNGVITAMTVFTMYFQGGLIPTFLLVKNLGLLNSRLSLILPVAVNTMNLIILRTSFKAIPDGLLESARIDGAGDLKILTKIVLPVSKASLAVITLYYAVFHWNSWFRASIYILRDRSLLPLQVILREILIANDTSIMSVDSNPGQMANLDIILKYATIMVATVPILALYPFLQRYFVKGIMVGSLKG